MQSHESRWMRASDRPQYRLFVALYFACCDVLAPFGLPAFVLRYSIVGEGGGSETAMTGLISRPLTSPLITSGVLPPLPPLEPGDGVGSRIEEEDWCTEEGPPDRPLIAALAFALAIAAPFGFPYAVDVNAKEDSSSGACLMCGYRA
jgi:hypothetical protein